MADQKGITLIELLVVLSILSIFSAIAYPPMRDWYQRACIRSEAAQLVGCLHMAKMEAVKVDSFVVIDANPDGYSVFVDNSSVSGETGDWIRQAGERLLVNYRLKSGITLDTNFTADKARFHGNREVIIGGRFILTDSAGRRMDVIIDTIGRIRVQ